MSVDRWHKCDLFPSLDNIPCVLKFVTFMTCDLWRVSHDHIGVARAEPHLHQIVTRPDGNWWRMVRGAGGDHSGQQSGQAH